MSRFEWKIIASVSTKNKTNILKLLQDMSQPCQSAFFDCEGDVSLDAEHTNGLSVVNLIIIKASQRCPLILVRTV